MPEACSECGRPCRRKGDSNRYRELCLACNQEVADARTPHVESCDDPECVVCLSYREEFSE